jgi:CHAT domain-containing protein/tetratricopeptide (TPR) repeat protein
MDPYLKAFHSGSRQPPPPTVTEGGGDGGQERLVQEWLTTGPTYRAERRFLEARPELLDPAAEAVLSDLIARAEALFGAGQADPAELASQIDALRTQRELLRDARERRQRLPVEQAIREAYVNARGGLTLDIPAWLEDVARQNEELRQRDALATAGDRIILWRQVLARVRADGGIAPEIVAEIAANLQTALNDASGLGQPELQEEEIACLDLALQVYTESRYPFQWATTQNNLGVVYQNRLRGVKEENQEAALECYRAALRVYTKDRFPLDWAMTQNNLGNVYSERLRGVKEENQEAAMACYQAALRVYTEDRFPVQWAMTQNNLGNVYSERLRGVKEENQEAAIACYQAALRVYTEARFPIEHRRTATTLADFCATLGRWDQAARWYDSAQQAETLLFALAGGARGQDLALRESRGLAARLAFALARVGRRDDALLAVERGRARSFAAARLLDAADPRRISDLARRERYVAARQGFIAAQATLNAPLVPAIDPATLPDDPVQREAVIDAAVRQEQSGRDAAFRAAKDRFDAAVAEIQAAKDPGDFLRDDLDLATVARAAGRGGSRHALAYLIATRWGGLALALAGGNAPREPLRVLARELPALTDSFVDDLVETDLPGDTRRVTGGFGWAQEGNGFGRLLQDWSGATFRQRVQALGDAVAAAGVESTLADAARAILATLDREDAAILADLPLDGLSRADLARLSPGAWHQLGYRDPPDPLAQAQLSGEQIAALHLQIRLTLDVTVGHALLQLELRRCLTALGDAAMAPLAGWLRGEGITSLTLLPSGMLAAFPLLAAPVQAGDLADPATWETFGDRLVASVAPSARALLLPDRTAARRTGIAALGNPQPTHQDLQWGEAEALHLVHLAQQAGLPAEVVTGSGATKAWLLGVLRRARVVDASCHGSFLSYDYLRSALLLAEDPAHPGETRFTLGEAISGMATLGAGRVGVDLHGLRLFILSACQTATLDLRGSRDEVRSLAVGLLQAGAEAVLAALWSVEDRATYLLIVRFAQEWLTVHDGIPNMTWEPPSAAFARAVRWLRTVTNRALAEWEAEHPLPPVSFPPRETAATKRAVRGRGDRLTSPELEAMLAALAQLYGQRYSIETARYIINNMGGRRVRDDQGDACPYADPIFWAGFQVNGW